jgi:hypothetical protein
VSGWSVLIWFLGGLLALALLGRWVTRLVQELAWALFADERAVHLLVYIMFLPGIIIHELSHWTMAWLLGMNPRGLSLWPKIRGKHVEMGSVKVTSGGVVRDSLTGMAPLLAGSVVVFLISHFVFDTSSLLLAWEDGGVALSMSQFGDAFSVPNAWVWIYIVFAVSNAMVPSVADRQPLLSLLAYSAVVVLALYVIGWMPQVTVPSQVSSTIAGLLANVSTGITFAIALDLIIAVPLLAIQVPLIALRQPE